MKTVHTRKIWAWSFGFLATVSFNACGKKDSDSNSAAPAKAPAVEITANNVDGSTARFSFRSETPGVTYECKVDRGMQLGSWQSCDPNNYEIQLEPGQGAVFNVRARVGELIGETYSQALSGPERFVVLINEKNNPSSVYQHEDEYQRDQLRITFSASPKGEYRYECKVGNQPGYRDCESPFFFERNANNTLPNVTVRAQNEATGDYSTTDTINLESYSDSGPARPMATSMQVGSYYQFIVPEGMHVTEFATTKTANRQLSAWRIMRDSDPYYNGNTACSSDWDEVVPAMSPSGRRLRYCNSTPTDDSFKWLTDFRWANNHLEVATEPQYVDQNPNGREIIMLNAFDSANLERMRETTRFGDLCGNATMQRINVHHLVPLFYDFWGDEVRASFWSCTVTLNSPSPYGLMESQQWRVGAFMIVNGRSEAPDFHCRSSCGEVPHLLEVVYMSRVNDSNAIPEFFARTAQRRFMEHLHPLQPN